jgi:hypothetical protein
MAPSAVVIKNITSTDTTLAATAAARRFEARERELRTRFELDLE